jgi:hypothetical protein
MCKKLIYLISFVLLLGVTTDVVSGQWMVKINFQRLADKIPEGYLPDYGEAFGNRGNGYRYGWNTNVASLAHNRVASTDPRYVTNIDMQDPETGTDYTWEIELPIGIYNIFLVCGDAYYDNHISNMDVEGTVLEDPDGPSNFDEYFVTVAVTDDRLTIKPAPGAIKTSLVFVEITRVETFKAYGPDPEDGSIYPYAFAYFTWVPGDAAVSHNIYVGDNFDDVKDGTPDTYTFRGNQTDESFSAGLPGDVYPDRLVPDTTYYWRIDEVNDAHPNSPWKGDVWSLKIAPQTAYNPEPADGATMVSLDATLSWTAGIGAARHYVYIGTDEDAVENATTDSLEYMGWRFTTSYNPDFIGKNTTYYWRIDEFDGTNTHKGDVWSFSTIPIVPITDPNLLLWWKFDENLDTATTAFDSSGYDHHGLINGTSLVLNGRINEARSFFGLTGDYVVDEDAEEYLNGLNAITVCMWIKSRVVGVDSGFIHSVYPHGKSDDAVTMRYDSAGLLGGGKNVFKMAVRVGSPSDPGNFGDEQVSYESTSYAQSTEWQHVTMTWSGGERIRFYINANEDAPTGYDDPGPSDCVIVYCNTLQVGASSYNPWNGLIDDVRIYNKVLVKDDVRRIILGEPDLAWNPSPANGSTPDLHHALPLGWSPGEFAEQHDVYFGTDKDAVADADTNTTEIYRGRQTDTSYTPAEGVQWGGGPYYWRIDEVSGDEMITKGRVWQFNVADFILVDDIEDYNNYSPDRIFETWKDGYGYTGYCGNGTGSTIGHSETPYAEETIVNSGDQSMPFYYDNSATGYNICSQPIALYYSEAERALDYPRNWTEQDVRALKLWFRGYAAGFKEEPLGTYTMVAFGRFMQDNSDQFRFAYKRLNGSGSIEAKVLNIQLRDDDNTKAGLMIRRNLDPGSPYAAVLLTAGGNCRFDYRSSPGDDTSNASNEPNIVAPSWIKLERDSSDNFNGYFSSDGQNWQAFDSNPQYVGMPGEVYIGLALSLKVRTAYSNAYCKAQFSDVTINGSVSPPVNVWTDEVIGTTMLSNDPEPMYVAIANNTGTTAVIYHDDPSAAQMDTWTEWNIALDEFSAQGVDLTDVNSLTIGFGDKSNPRPGGSGCVFFDDIRLYP